MQTSTSSEGADESMTGSMHAWLLVASCAQVFLVGNALLLISAAAAMSSDSHTRAAANQDDTLSACHRRGRVLLVAHLASGCERLQWWSGLVV
jgi:hypothetical protein